MSADFLNGLENVVDQHGPPGLTNAEKLALCAQLGATARNFMEAKLVGGPDDELTRPMQQCLVVMNELSPSDAGDVAVNVLARVIIVMVQEEGGDLGVALRTSELIGDGLKNCIRANWSADQTAAGRC